MAGAAGLGLAAASCLATFRAWRALPLCAFALWLPSCRLLDTASCFAATATSRFGSRFGSAFGVVTRAAVFGAALLSAARAGAGCAGVGGSRTGGTGSISGTGFTTSAAIGVDAGAFGRPSSLTPITATATIATPIPMPSSARPRRGDPSGASGDGAGAIGTATGTDGSASAVIVIESMTGSGSGNTSTGSLASADVAVGGFTCVGSESVSVTSGITTAGGGAFRSGGGVFRTGAGVGGGRSSAWAGVSDRALPAAGATVGRTDGARAGAGAAIVRATAAAAPPRTVGGADGADTARTDAEVARAGAGAAGGDSAIASGAGPPSNGSARWGAATPTIVARRFFGVAAAVAGGGAGTAAGLGAPATWGEARPSFRDNTSIALPPSGRLSGAEQNGQAVPRGSSRTTPSGNGPWQRGQVAPLTAFGFPSGRRGRPDPTRRRARPARHRTSRPFASRCLRRRRTTRR